MSNLINLNRRRILINQGAVLDSDAQIYINALNTHTTVSAPHKSIINTLFVDLKSNGFYDDIIAFYPVYGNTSDLQKYNAKNPLNTDLAHRLTFSASTTHSFNSFNISSASGENANTHINTLNDTILNNACGFVYSKTDSQTNTVDIGFSGGQFFGRRTANLLLSDAYITSGGSRVTSTNTTSLGLMGFSLLPSPEKHSVYSQGVLLNSRNDITGSLTDSNVIIGNRASVDLNGTGRGYGFAFFSKGLTDSQVTTLNSIITTYITDINI